MDTENLQLSYHTIFFRLFNIYISLFQVFQVCIIFLFVCFSPYFQRIFSENPCKHPVIVLKDLRGWEVQAIVDFMYKGEISVVQEQLSSLIKAAESLQVGGYLFQNLFPYFAHI